MPEILSHIERDHILNAIQKIDEMGVPLTNQWSEYWINYQFKLYPFKFVVQEASNYSDRPFKTRDFTTNDSSLLTIAGLNFHILYRTPKYINEDIKYWVGLKQMKLPEHMQGKAWTPTSFKIMEGKEIHEDRVLEKNIQVNDRALVYFCYENQEKPRYTKQGTVSAIRDSRLKIHWDYHAPNIPADASVIRAVKQHGLMPIKRKNHIEYIFGERFTKKANDIFEFESGQDDESIDEEFSLTSNYVREKREVEIKLLHKQISRSLTKYLVSIYGSINVRAEHPVRSSQKRIDLLVRTKCQYYFYEIKTYLSIKTSIREALGQLLEYTFDIGVVQPVEMIIISHIPADDSIVKYMEFLRESYKMPLYYQCFDIKTFFLSEKV
jgi:hypothetical protein